VKYSVVDGSLIEIDLRILLSREQVHVVEKSYENR
jgi:hypothetical protein